MHEKAPVSSIGCHYGYTTHSGSLYYSSLSASFLMLVNDVFVTDM